MRASKSAPRRPGRQARRPLRPGGRAPRRADRGTDLLEPGAVAESRQDQTVPRPRRRHVPEPLCSAVASSPSRASRSVHSAPCSSSSGSLSATRLAADQDRLPPHHTRLAREVGPEDDRPLEALGAVNRRDGDDVFALAVSRSSASGSSRFRASRAGTEEVADVAVAELAGQAEKLADVGEGLLAGLAQGDEVGGVARGARAGPRAARASAPGRGAGRARPPAGCRSGAEAARRPLPRGCDPRRSLGLAHHVEQGLVAHADEANGLARAGEVRGGHADMATLASVADDAA